MRWQCNSFDTLEKDARKRITKKDLPHIGVKCGKQYINMKCKHLKATTIYNAQSLNQPTILEHMWFTLPLNFGFHTKIGLVISFFVGLGMVEILISLGSSWGTWGACSSGFQGGPSQKEKLVCNGIPHAWEWPCYVWIRINEAPIQVSKDGLFEQQTWGGAFMDG